MAQDDGGPQGGGGDAPLRQDAAYLGAALEVFRQTRPLLPKPPR